MTRFSIRGARASRAPTIAADADGDAAPTHFFSRTLFTLIAVLSAALFFVLARTDVAESSFVFKGGSATPTPSLSTPPPPLSTEIASAVRNERARAESAEASAAASELRAVASDLRAAAADARAAAAMSSRAWSLPVGARMSLPPARESPYSSFECTSGSQDFTRAYPIPMQGTHKTHFPDAADAFMRVCVLRNVCFVNDELFYYEDPALAASAPEHLLLSGFRETIVRISYMQAAFGKHLYEDSRRYDKNFSATVVVGPRPSDLPFFGDANTDRDVVHALGHLSFANNWGHLLVDTILPAFAALDIFGFNHSQLQLLNLVDCAGIVNAQHEIGFMPGTHADACRTNVERWLAPAFARPFAPAPKFYNSCMRQLIVGHESSLSLKGLFHHRASAIRSFRAILNAAYGVQRAVFARHSIVVLEKTAMFNSVEIPNLCELVRTAAIPLRAAGEAISVTCVQPSLLSATEQLELYSSTTLAISENGSTGYASVFLPAGSSFISVLVGKGEVAKECQVFLYLGDVQAFYLKADDVTPGALLLALERAGTRLNLPVVSL